MPKLESPYLVTTNQSLTREHICTNIQYFVTKLTENIEYCRNVNNQHNTGYQCIEKFGNADTLAQLISKLERFKSNNTNGQK